jgi:1-acyl-sn-glycerol-3-phosphate acyltransferase
VRAGCLAASPASAARAFAAGNLVLVYPGSDRDTFRPFRARYRIELGGRVGFVRTALRARVPIVPVVSTGTHEQFVVLARGDALARALGLRRWLRTDVFPVALAVPWGLTSGFLPYVPLPARTTLAFAPALRWPELPPAAADDPAVVARCYAEVRDAMQSALDRLARDHRPWIGPRHRADAA